MFAGHAPSDERGAGSHYHLQAGSFGSLPPTAVVSGHKQGPWAAAVGRRSLLQLPHWQRAIYRRSSHVVHQYGMYADVAVNGAHAKHIDQIVKIVNCL